MALEKKVVVDKIEVLEQGQVQVRTSNIIMEDGVELSRGYHRHVLNPGDDVSGQDARVSAIANATWTPEVVSDWKASLTVVPPGSRSEE